MKIYFFLLLPLLGKLTLASESCFKYYRTEAPVLQKSPTSKIISTEKTEPANSTLNFHEFSNRLRNSPYSFKDYELNQFIEASLLDLKQNYARILGQLSKEGSANQLGSVLKIVDALSTTTEQLIQATNTALEKEKIDSEKLKKMSEELKVCFTKIGTCQETADNVIISTNSYLLTAKQFKDLIGEYIKSLEDFKAKMNADFSHTTITADELPSLNEKIDMHLKILSGYVHIIDSHLKTVQANLTSLSMSKGNLSILEEQIALLEANGLKIDIFKDYLEKLSGKNASVKAINTKEVLANTPHGTEIINLLSSSHNPDFVLGLQHSIIEILLGKKLNSFGANYLRSEFKNFKRLSIKDISDIAALMEKFNLNFSSINFILYEKENLLSIGKYNSFTYISETSIDNYSYLKDVLIRLNLYGGLHFYLGTIFNRVNDNSMNYEKIVPIIKPVKHAPQIYLSQKNYEVTVNKYLEPFLSKIEPYFTFLSLADLKISKNKSVQIDIYFNKISEIIDEEISQIKEKNSKQGFLQKINSSLNGAEPSKIAIQTLEFLKLEVESFKRNYIHFLISNRDYLD